MNYTLHQTIQSEAPCKLCGGHELQVIGTQGRHFQKLTTTICKGCGLIHSYPIPTKGELDEYYSKQYRSDYKSAYPLEFIEAMLFWNPRRIVKRELNKRISKDSRLKEMMLHSIHKLNVWGFVPLLCA